MTGVAENGEDAEAWKAWLGDQRLGNPPDPAADDRFREGILSRLRRQPTGMAPEAAALIQRLYQQIGAAQAAQKPALLTEVLSAPNPAERIVGVQAYEQDILLGQLPAARAAVPSARVRDMIGDSSPAVREQVARTLGTLADKSAIDAMVTQLAMEPKPQVKVELLRALARMGDPRVVPQVLRLLNDPSARVKTAAADALRALGASIRTDAALAAQVVAALRAVIDNKNNGSDIRAAAVEALVPLADASTQFLFIDLVNEPKQGEEIRLAALRGISQIGDARAASKVSDLMTADRERSPRVRLAAIEALAKVGSFGYSEILYNIFTNPALEPDPSVRDRAWRTFQTLLPTGQPGQLREYADRFGRMAAADPPDKVAVDMSRHLAVLQEIAARDARQPDRNSQDDLAGQRENIGAAYVQLKQPDQAIGYFRQALDYWMKNDNRPVVTEKLIGELMDALLVSGKYADAVKFADEMISKNREMERIVGGRLAVKAEDLLDPPSAGPGRPGPPPNPREALNLATEALTLHNLGDYYRGRLEGVRTKAQKAVGSPATPGAPGAPAAPGTGSPPAPGAH
jgi:HEAT repeat protein